MGNCVVIINFGRNDGVRKVYSGYFMFLFVHFMNIIYVVFNSLPIDNF